MSRKNRQRSAELVVVLLGLVLLVGLFGFDSTEASSQEPDLIYFPIIKNDGGIVGEPWTPSPTDRPTPQREMPTLAPTMNICPLCPTKTPFVICLPSPCDGG